MYDFSDRDQEVFHGVWFEAQSYMSGRWVAVQSYPTREEAEESVKTLTSWAPKGTYRVEPVTV
jgi:hypothetical protein